MIEVPFIHEVNFALTKQLEEFTYEQWQVYIDDWTPSLLCLISITLQRDCSEEEMEFWLNTVASMQFEEQLKIEILLLATVDPNVYDLLLDAIDERIAAIQKFVRIEDLSTLSEV